MTKIIVLSIIAIVVVIFAFSFFGKGKTTEPTNLATVTEKTSEKMEKEVTMKEGELMPLNKSASTLRWSAKKITGQTNHTGTVDLKEGDVLVSDGNMISSTVVMDMTTIKNEDLTSEAANEKLVSHLKSDDFFSVQSFPEASFVIKETATTPNSTESTHQITGDLTIKGITKQISFPAKIMIAEEKISADATFSINRADWDIRFGSNTFFDNLGDNAIDDFITFQVHLET